MLLRLAPKKHRAAAAAAAVAALCLPACQLDVTCLLPPRRLASTRTTAEPLTSEAHHHDQRH